MTVYPRFVWRLVVAGVLSYLLIKTSEVAAPGWYVVGLFALAWVTNYVELRS